MNRKNNREISKIEWVTMNMRLDGSPLSLESAAKIAAGEYVLDATLEQHMMVTHLTEAVPLINTLLSMQEELSPSTLGKFYKAVSGGETPTYRKTTPILFHLSYNPILPQEIEEELRKLFAEVHKNQMADPIDEAVFIHDHIIRIYPFNDFNEIIARAALTYQLMFRGRPAYQITLQEQEYNQALAEFLKKGKEEAICENLKLNRLMLESNE